MLKLEIADQKYNVPESWAECHWVTQQRLAVFVGLEPTRVNCEQAIIALMANDKPSSLKSVAQWWQTIEMQAGQWHELCLLLKWLFEKGPTQLAVDHLIVPIIGKLGFRKLYFTAPQFQEATAIEIAWILVAWSTFSTDPAKAEDQLNELLAIICRPLRNNLKKAQKTADYNGDPRQPLTQHLVEELKPQVAKMPYYTKTVLLKYIGAMVADFLEEFKMLFQAKSGAKVEYPKGFAWEAHLRTVSETGRYGTYNQVCQTNGRQIWLNEYQTHLERKAMEAAQKAAEGFKD